jgi:cellulose synthase/poly-beta-1,6-N-acetylglucosamine synthase-like glycosyltransferase
MLVPIICLSIVSAFVIILIALIFFVAAGKKQPQIEIAETDLPFISILVAARNEEQNITRCLQSLCELDYPTHKLEILVGNDGSEDQTGELVTRFAEQNKSVKLFNITETIGKAKGKANVLGQLAHQTKGEYFLITDADITVNNNWAKELISHFTEPKTGIVSGITLVHGPTLLQKLQGVDWLYFMGLLKGFDNAGLHCAAVGNNMAIRKEAYQSVGGYEEIDFSVTEDYKLYKEVRKKGWSTHNIITRNSLNISQPVTNFLQLMHQRKRWLIGAKELPLYWWLLFGVLGAFLPAIIILAIYQPILAVKFYLIKVALQTLFVLYLQQRLGIGQNVFIALLYDVYANIIAIATQIFYVLPITMQWKKRKYN